MTESIGLTQISAIAKSINSQELEGGSVQCMELEIESARQLAEVLSKSREERVFVFRGPLGSRPAKLKNWSSEKLRAVVPAAEVKTNGGGAGEKPLQAVFLNFDKLTKIVEHVRGDQVISVESGIKLKDLNNFLSNHGQWLPIEYFSEDLTLADVLETADGGYLEPYNGGVKNLVLGMELGITSGEIIKTGGKIVKNVTGYDLSKIFTGSRNWLAVPYMVHLRLFSKPEKESSFIVSCSKPQELIALANLLRATGLPAACVEAIDTRLLQLCSKQDGNSALAADANSFLSVCSEHEAVLLISTRGHEEVADEVAKALRQAVEKTGLKIAELAPDLANRMQRLCSEIFSVSKIDCVELSLSASCMSYFFETFWQQHGKPLWSARTATGRLKVGFESEANSQRLTDLIDELNEFAELVNKDGMQPVTVAYPTADSELTVRHLASDAQGDSAVNEVVRRLKAKYDPEGILNPLVSFCQ